MNAIWATDYDMHTDSCYQRPSCPECREPIGLREDNKYHCFACGEVVEVKDSKMLAWFQEREETKVELEDCPKIISKDGEHLSGCGGKKCVETLYVKNPVTLKWEARAGRCKNCGTSFIV